MLVLNLECKREKVPQSMATLEAAHLGCELIVEGLCRSYGSSSMDLLRLTW